RRHEHARPHGLAHREDPPLARGVDHVAAVDAHGLLGEPTQKLRGVGDLGARLGQCLAHLERHQQRQLVGLSDDRLIGASQDLAALAWRRGRPLGLAVRRRRKRRQRISLVGVGDLDEWLLRRGVLHGQRPPRARGAPLSGGVETVRDALERRLLGLATWRGRACLSCRARAPLIAALLGAALWWACPAVADDLVVTGGGYGHGVGMSQEGALGYAQRGASYQAILTHYYLGTGIGRVSAGVRVKVLVGNKVRQLPLETYVRGVVAAEMPASWPAAALEAQAVASRTYALTAHAGGSRFDVYADTRSQVYRGVAAQTPQTDAAVAATADQVVTYAGRLVITYFFAGSGGRTESVENGFPGSA